MRAALVGVLRKAEAAWRAVVAAIAVAAAHLFAVGLATNRGRVLALSGGVLLLCGIVTPRSTPRVLRRVAGLYHDAAYYLNLAVAAVMVGLGAMRLITSALADDPEAMETSAHFVAVVVAGAVLVHFALAVVADLFGFRSSPFLPWRATRSHRTAAEVQRGVLDRLAEQWRQGR